MRQLIDGTQVPELDEARTFSIKTKCPEKWVLVDMETGEVYTPYPTEGSLQWKRVDTESTD